MTRIIFLIPEYVEDNGYLVRLSVNECDARFQTDTGADVNIINCNFV